MNNTVVSKQLKRSWDASHSTALRAKSLTARLLFREAFGVRTRPHFAFRSPSNLFDNCSRRSVTCSAAADFANDRVEIRNHVLARAAVFDQAPDTNDNGARVRLMLNKFRNHFFT